MFSSPKRVLSGSGYESTVCEYLVQNMYKIIVRNFVSNHGEIDIIASKNNLIYLVEVKKRSSFAENCLTEAQMERIWYTYNIFLENNPKYKNVHAILQLALFVNGKTSIIDIL